MIIGISGKIGTGKSHVCKFLKKKLNFKLIKAEAIKVELLQEPDMHSKLVHTFGKKILTPGGKVDKNKLLVTAGIDMLRLGVLSDYLDRRVGEIIKTLVEANDDNYIIDTDSPVRQGITHLFDVSVLVISPKNNVYRRLIDRYPKKIIFNLWRWQKDIKNYDYLIENKTSITDLKADVDQLVVEMFRQNTQE